MKNKKQADDYRLKDFKALSKRCKSLEKKIFALVGARDSTAIKKHGVIQNPKAYLASIELLKEFEPLNKRLNELSVEPEVPCEVRLDLPAECQFAFDLGFAWAARYQGTVNGAKGKFKYKRMEQLMLLEAERLWKLKKTKSLSRNQMIDRLCKLKLSEWVVISDRLGISYKISELAKIKSVTATEVFKQAAQNHWIEMPEDAASSGRPKK